MSRFLIKGNPLRQRGPHSVQIADDLGVRSTLLLKRVANVGPFTQVEGNGLSKTRIDINLREGSNGRGERLSRTHRFYVHGLPAKAAEVKKVLRRLRPQEEEAIDALDVKRNDLLAQLGDIELEREELVRGAFSKGHAVQVKELREMAEAQAAEEATI